jgi:hypothetical protein
VLGFTTLYDGSEKAGWGISILGFVLMLLAFFKVATVPSMRKDTPAFIWLLLGFFIFGEINSLVHWYSAEEFFGSFKRYFQMWGLLFALCWLAFDEQYIRRWRMFFLIVAVAQLPCAIYELIVLVPQREGMRGLLSGMVPIDAVAGTFGTSIYGGGRSGDMATFLIIVLAFLLVRGMQKVLPVKWLTLLIAGVLAPLFIGETKIVIIMLPVMLIVLYRRELLARPHYGLMALAVGGLLTVCMGYAYLNIMHTSLEKLFADTLRYNLYEQGYGENHLNRTTALTFWVDNQGAHDPVSFMFGNGLGSSHLPTGGHVNRSYPNYGIGLTSASTLLWDTGVFGCSLIIAVFIMAWRTAGRLCRESTDPMVRADAAAIQASLWLFFIHIFYSGSLLDSPGFQIVFVAVLGYLAWLHRRWRVGSRP